MIIKTLQSIELFQGLDEIFIKKIAAEALEYHMEKNEILFHEGDISNTAFIIINGSLKVIKSNEDGQEVTIRIAGKGDLIAEATLFKESAYPGTAVAIKKSLLIGIRREIFLQYLEDEQFRLDFIQSLIDKIHYLSGRIKHLTLLSIEEKFAHFIKSQYGFTDSVMITLPKKEIAALMGCTAETFSRMIKYLENNNYITWQQKILVISKDFWKKFYHDI